PLEKLHRPLVTFGRHARAEGAEVTTLAGARVFLARVETILAASNLLYHGYPSLSGPLFRGAPRHFSLVDAYAALRVAAAFRAAARRPAGPFVATASWGAPRGSRFRARTIARERVREGFRCPRRAARDA